MIYYSHRGNLEGPNPQKENSPEYIDVAIETGFEAEVDLHVIGKNIFLGHDFPQYEIDWLWLIERKNKLLIHAKNFPAARMLSLTDFHYFFHSNDKFALTSKGSVWVHDLSLNIDDVTNCECRCIVPLITLELIRAFNKKKMNGICTDFVIASQNKYKL